MEKVKLFSNSSHFYKTHLIQVGSYKNENYEFDIIFSCVFHSVLFFHNASKDIHCTIHLKMNASGRTGTRKISSFLREDTKRNEEHTYKNVCMH